MKLRCAWNWLGRQRWEKQPWTKGKPSPQQYDLVVQTSQMSRLISRCSLMGLFVSRPGLIMRVSHQTALWQALPSAILVPQPVAARAMASLLCCANFKIQVCAHLEPVFLLARKHSGRSPCLGVVRVFSSILQEPYVMCRGLCAPVHQSMVCH